MAGHHLPTVGQGGQHFGEIILIIRFNLISSQNNNILQTEQLAGQLDKDLPGGSPVVTSWPKYGWTLSMIIHDDDQDNSTDMGEDLSVPGEPLSSFCGINMMMMKMMRIEDGVQTVTV